VGQVDLPPDAGAHTTFPVLGVPVPAFVKNEPGKLRDFVVVTGETVRIECLETRQMVRIFDITTESTPVGVSTCTIPEESGNFCTRGGHFVTHSSSENFTAAYYYLHRRPCKHGPSYSRAHRLGPPGRQSSLRGLPRRLRQASNA
jgi:hypothetical protein